MNSDWATFQEGGSKQLFFEALPPAPWLITTVANNCCKKSCSLYSTFQEDERDHIKGVLSN